MTYIKACINGSRTPEMHPALPVTPVEIAQAALDAQRAGARAVHLHPKTVHDGMDSLMPEVVGAAVTAVRVVAPGLPVGVTTGFWALPDPQQRLRAVESWVVLPDFASVNWHEPGSEDLAKLLLSRGLGIEVGIFNVEAAQSWARSEVAAQCGRVMIELGPEGTSQDADELLALIEQEDLREPILLHGLDASCWPLLAHAGLRGLQARIGMEDTLLLPDGSVAPGNAELVGAAVKLLSAGRP